MHGNNLRTPRSIPTIGQLRLGPSLGVRHAGWLADANERALSRPEPSDTVPVGVAGPSSLVLGRVQGCVKSIVTEKELRLREGMALLGLRGQAYWASWFLTHFSTLALSSCLMALVSPASFCRRDSVRKTKNASLRSACAAC